MVFQVKCLFAIDAIAAVYRAGAGTALDLASTTIARAERALLGVGGKRLA
jgi:hypothetical protein